MSWYDEDYARRAAITIRVSDTDNPADSDIIIPQDWDEFWEVIDDDGYGLRVTIYDGITLATYDVDDGAGGAFDKAAREGRIRVDGLVTAGLAGAIYCLWVYFDVETPTDGTSAVTITGAHNGYIDLGSPAWVAITLQPIPVDTDEPRDVFALTPDDQIYVWIDITPFLELRRTPYAGRDIYEEPARLTLEAVDQDEVDASAAFDAGQCRFVEITGPGGQGRSVYVRLAITGGAEGDSFTLRPILTTDFPPDAGEMGRDQRITMGLQMLDPLEPAP